MKYNVVHVYFVLLRTGNIKIGVSRHVHLRVRELHGRLLATIPVIDVEKTLHKLFARHLIGNEVFRPDQEILNFIKDLDLNMGPVMRFSELHGRRIGPPPGPDPIVKLAAKRATTYEKSKATRASRLSEFEQKIASFGDVPAIEIARKLQIPLYKVKNAMKRIHAFAGSAS